MKSETRLHSIAANIEVIVNVHAAQTAATKPTPPSTSQKLLWQTLQRQQQLHIPVVVHMELVDDTKTSWASTPYVIPQPAAQQA